MSVTITNQEMGVSGKNVQGQGWGRRHIVQNNVYNLYGRDYRKLGQGLDVYALQVQLLAAR